MEVLKSVDLERLIRSIDIELTVAHVTLERREQLSLKKKLLRDELASRILLEAFEN
jgi:hypothetical protein